MKLFIVIANVILGLLIAFYGGVNNLLHLINLATQDPSNQYYYEMSLSQGFAEAFFWIIIGVFSIVSAFAFKRDKHWAILTLPLPPLTLFLYIVYILYSSTKSDLAWTGGIIMISAIVLFVLLILEISYITLRKKT